MTQMTPVHDTNDVSVHATGGSEDICPSGRLRFLRRSDKHSAAVPRCLTRYRFVDS